MKTVSMIGAIVVTLALTSYSIGFFKERRLKLVNQNVLLFYSIGISLDISATVLMIIGSSKGMMTLHGFIGYSSLLGMLIDTFLLWKHYMMLGSEKTIGISLHKYSKIAYSWWVIAYITGGLLVIASKV